VYPNLSFTLYPNNVVVCLLLYTKFNWQHPPCLYHLVLYVRIGVTYLRPMIHMTLHMYCSYIERSPRVDVPMVTKYHHDTSQHELVISAGSVYRLRCESPRRTGIPARSKTR
jgi:hypothetical protein